MFQPEDFQSLSKQQRADVKFAAKACADFFQSIYTGSKISKPAAFFGALGDWILFQFIGLIDFKKFVKELKEVPTNPGDDDHNYNAFMLKLLTFIDSLGANKLAELSRWFVHVNIERRADQLGTENVEFTSDSIRLAVSTWIATYDDKPFGIKDMLINIVHFGSDLLLPDHEQMTQDDFLQFCADFNPLAPTKEKPKARKAGSSEEE